MHHGGHLALHVRRRPEDRGRLVPPRAVRRRVLPQGELPRNKLSSISNARALLPWRNRRLRAIMQLSRCCFEVQGNLLELTHSEG